MHGLLAAGIWNACRLSSSSERQAIISWGFVGLSGNTTPGIFPGCHVPLDFFSPGSLFVQVNDLKRIGGAKVAADSQWLQSKVDLTRGSLKSLHSHRRDAYQVDCFDILRHP